MITDALAFNIDDHYDRAGDACFSGTLEFGEIINFYNFEVKFFISCWILICILR